MNKCGLSPFVNIDPDIQTLKSVFKSLQCNISDAAAAPALSPRHSSEGLISNWTAAVHESLTKPIENVSDVEYSLVQNSLCE